MKERHKAYIRVNLVSIVLAAISFISITLAWFAYSGISNVQTEIGVKAWNIELKKDGKKESNNITISSSEISPGMATKSEVVNIKNLGDSDATLSYNIVSARILNEEITVDGETTTEELEDAIAHEYPFHININISKNYILKGGSEATFEVSISWPLDSNHNDIDTSWGNEAYAFQLSEQQKPADQRRTAIQIVINVSAEQYINSESSSDVRYNLGDIVLIDVVTKKRCLTLSDSDTCIKTYIIDKNSTIGDETIKLLPDPYTTYVEDIYTNYGQGLAAITRGWTVTTMPLTADDILKVISTDIINSYRVIPEISDSIIGNLKYNNRMQTEINNIKLENGSYEFLNAKFPYMVSTNCYWVDSEYSLEDSFAVKKEDENIGKLYNQSKNTKCNIIPKIIANKEELEA